MESYSESGHELFTRSQVFSSLMELRSSEALKVLESRLSEFREFRSSSAEVLFSELCFCILTANTSAEMGLRTQNGIGIDGFLNLTGEELSKKLKDLKYRFYNVRSRFIVDARNVLEYLPEIVNSEDPRKAREFLIYNVPGISYKEASHFLRNVGVFDLAILDKHILRMMNNIDPSLDLKVTPPRRYLEKEQIFIEYSRTVGMEPGELDLYLWFIATGKVIK